MKRLIVHSEAELELWQAVDYYETKSSGLGLDLECEVSRAFMDIQEAPERWPIGKRGARRRLLRRFPYAIHYLEMEGTTWIVAVAHLSRKPYYCLKRLNNL